VARGHSQHSFIGPLVTKKNKEKTTTLNSMELRLIKINQNLYDWTMWEFNLKGHTLSEPPVNDAVG